MKYLEVRLNPVAPTRGLSDLERGREAGTGYSIPGPQPGEARVPCRQFNPSATPSCRRSWP